MRAEISCTSTTTESRAKFGTSKMHERQTCHSDRGNGTSGTLCAGICDCSVILVHLVFVYFLLFVLLCANKYS